MGQGLDLGNQAIQTNSAGIPVFTGSGGLKPTTPSGIKNIGFLNGLAAAESTNNPLAVNPKSSASGLFGFTDQTFVDTLSKAFPGVDTSNLTKEQIAALKADPMVSSKVADTLTSANASALSYAGMNPNDPANLYAAHFLGSTLAIKALQADPNAPISSVATEKQIAANKSILGGDKTVGDVLGILGNKINNAISTSGNLVGNILGGATNTASDVVNAAINAPSNFANTLGSMLNGTFTPTSDSTPPTLPASTPSEDVTSQGIRAALQGGAKLADTQTSSRISDSQLADLTGSVMSDAYRSPEETAATNAVAEVGGAPGGNPDAANITPKGEIDWSKGNLPFIDNTKAKEDLYNQPNPNFPGQNIANSVTGDTPETYAQKFTGGDVSQVQSRISYVNGFPQVEFFAKGLDQVAGDMFKAITSIPGAIMDATGNLLSPKQSNDLSYLPINPSNPGLGNSSSDTGGVSNYTGPVSDKLSDIIKTASSSGLDTSAFTGKKDTTSVSTASTTPSVPATPSTPAPVTNPGITPVRTGMDLSGIGTLYRGNPVVQTSSIAYPNFQPYSRFS